MFVTRIRMDTDPGTDWPFTMAAIVHLREHGLEFKAPVTFLVGENGSGKSTIVEAMADVCKIAPFGGKAGTRYSSTGEMTPLGRALTADMTVAGLRLTTGPRAKRHGFFLRAETLFDLARNVRGKHGFWDQDLEKQSHGEGFMTVFEAMFTKPGLYLMDEPEAALSFTSCLRLVGLMAELERSGSQIICATHSPILAATPGADIVELGDNGIRSVEWNGLGLVDHWRRFLNVPNTYLRHITGAD